MSAPARRSSNLVRLSISLALLAGAAFVFLNRQQLFDQYTVWRFSPSSEIVAIADKAAFSEQGKFLFYASRPELLERDAFNDVCRSVASENTAILGCFSMSRIYLFDIDNKKLEGVKEVTAAHEMLHAVYQRLSIGEKARVDALLEKQPLGDDEARIGELMAEYEKTEPGERMNELHSIIGSEIRDLTPELEAYYAQYFDDRAALVAQAETYQAVFQQLEAQQDTLVSELNALADGIDSDSARYRRNLQVLEADIRAFNQRANSGTMTRAEYDRERAALELRQQALRSDYSGIQAQIRTYEQKRTELATINSESNALNRSINSAMAPVPETEELDG